MSLINADDITIFSETAEGLQVGLDILEKYCDRWKLTVNTEKTKIMVFRKGGILPRNLKFYYKTNELEIVRSFSYLGIVFTSGGSFSCAQTTLASQAQKAIYKLNSYLYKFSDISPKHVLDLYDKLVTPILNYGSEIWGFCKGKQIERVHMQFCKTLLGVKTSTQNNFIYGELGRINYQTRRYFIIIKYWLKVIQKADNKYVNVIYKLMLRDIDSNARIINWVSLVRHLLYRLGFNDVWLFQGVGDNKVFLSIVKQRLHDQFGQRWHEELEISSRALFYRNIADFEFQNYLDVINVRKFRVAMSKLRVSSHRLEIGTGRSARPNSIPFDQRVCKICRKLEDEYHFILECPIYDEIRNIYIKRYYTNRPNMYKFIELITSKNEKEVRYLGIYISKAFVLRQNVVYITDLV